MGGWQAGKEDWVGIDDEDSIAAFRAAFEAGVTTFDTAEEYGNGHSERTLSRALREHRDEITIASKVSWRNLSAEAVVRACERSLVNLATDRIDLYQIHWPAGSFGSARVPLEETLEALVGLRQAGKIRCIGVSNFNAAQLAESIALAPVDSIQVPYSLLWREIESELLPLARSARLTVMAYSPLAQGLLAGSVGPERTFSSTDNRSENKLLSGSRRESVQAVLPRLRSVAVGQRITVAQLALAWLIARAQVVPVVGARNAAQARENAGAASVAVDPQALDEADRICRDVAESFRPEQVMWSWNVE
jgi:myo-inositol catabolism protein IolS